jgi:hypothetical protein
MIRQLHNPNDIYSIAIPQVQVKNQPVFSINPNGRISAWVIH